MGCSASKTLPEGKEVAVKHVMESENKSVVPSKTSKVAVSPFSSPFEPAASDSSMSHGSSSVSDPHPSGDEHSTPQFSASFDPSTSIDPKIAVQAIGSLTAQLGPGSASLYDTTAFSTEAARLEALHNCAMLDTAPEGRFDAITELAATLFKVPVAVVSLVDSDRGWFKSNYGPFQGCVAREGSFCSYIVVPDYAEVRIVEDCTKDARFANNPFVTGPPELRYYSGCPLVTSTGHRIGTLCLCDFRPRHLPSTAYNILCNLAEIIVREVERDVVQKQLLAAEKAESADAIMSPSTVLPEKFEEKSCSTNGGDFCRLLPAAPAAREPVIIVNTADAAWPIIYGNQAFADMLDVDINGLIGGNFWDVLEKEDPAATIDKLVRDVETGKPARVLTRQLGSTGTGTVYKVEFWLACRDQLKNSVPVSIPGFVAIDEKSVDETASLPLNALWIGTASLVSGGSVKSDGSSNGSLNSEGLKTAKSVASTFSPRSSLDNERGPATGRLQGLKLGPLLGQGSYGKVYRGSIGQKPVAVKIIEVPLNVLPAGSANEKVKVTPQQALLEASISRHLAHPNIVPTLDYLINQKHSTDDMLQVWIVQHLCNRGTLYDAIDRGYLRETPSVTAAPSLAAVLNTAIDIAFALKYLHEEDILHGDLSGNNVLLSSCTNQRGYMALISDFGLSRMVPLEVHTQTIGTVSHMPPELLVDGKLTKAADVYAFGIILWEMWQGKRAWAGAALGNIIFQVTCAGKRLEMSEDCPAPIRDVAWACTDPDDSKRPTFDEIVPRLEAIKAELLA